MLIIETSHCQRFRSQINRDSLILQCMSDRSANVCNRCLRFETKMAQVKELILLVIRYAQSLLFVINIPNIGDWHQHMTPSQTMNVICTVVTEGPSHQNSNNGCESKMQFKLPVIMMKTQANLEILSLGYSSYQSGP